MTRIRRIVIVVGFAFAAPVQLARAADIVFDPTNFGANAEQVLHHLQEIARLEEQIRNQFQMLENWRFTRLDQLLASMQSIRQAIDEADALDLAHRYPIVSKAYAQRDAKAMQALRQQWLQSQREALIQAQMLQNRTVSEMPGTQRRVGEYVQRSNSAPGQTAVLQAGNETLATLTGQLQSLEALDISQTRIELEEDAHRQAQAAFQRQRRNRMMKDWPVTGALTKPQAAVRFLFASSESK